MLDSLIHWVVQWNLIWNVSFRILHGSHALLSKINQAKQLIAPWVWWEKMLWFLILFHVAFQTSNLFLKQFSISSLCTGWSFFIRLLSQLPPEFLSLPTSSSHYLIFPQYPLPSFLHLSSFLHWNKTIYPYLILDPTPAPVLMTMMSVSESNWATPAPFQTINQKDAPTYMNPLTSEGNKCLHSCVNTFIFSVVFSYFIRSIFFESLSQSRISINLEMKLETKKKISTPNVVSLNF